MQDCLFCKIIAGEIPSQKVYEDDDVFAFRDIAPQMPTHVLVVPKRHVSGVTEAAAVCPEVFAKCLAACAKVAALAGVSETGYRVVSNCGKDACQSVQHLHFHVLGGGKMSGTMG